MQDYNPTDNKERIIFETDQNPAVIILNLYKPIHCSQNCFMTIVQERKTLKVSFTNKTAQIHLSTFELIKKNYVRPIRPKKWLLNRELEMLLLSSPLTNHFVIAWEMLYCFNTSFNATLQTASCNNLKLFIEMTKQQHISCGHVTKSI